MSYSIFVKDGTAQGVAKQRLIETIADPEKNVINDPYAEAILILRLLGYQANHHIGIDLTEGRSLP